MRRREGRHPRNQPAQRQGRTAWALVGACVWAAAVASSVGAQDSPSAGAPPAVASTLRAHVSYLSSNAVYLDAGREEGVAVGARAQVVRNGELVAEIEVDFVAAHSASCRVMTQRQTLRQGDDVILALSSPESSALTIPSSPLPLGGSAGRGPAPEPAQTPPVPSIGEPARPGGSLSSPRAQALETQLTGSFSLGVQNYTDRLLAGQGYQEGTGRLVLRGRSLFGVPLDLRTRMSARQTERRNSRGSVRDPRIDRLYELSLSYAPKEGRFSAMVGRLGAGPFVSVGYLDGLLAQVRAGRNLYFGVLAGSRPEVAEIGLASIGRKYGVFTRYASSPDPGRADVSPRYSEIILAAVGEYATGGEVSREYVAIESRFGSGARWSVFQRAEIDFNRDWRQDVAGKANQISNASLSASVRLSSRWRALVSYDQRREYLTWETRPRPEDVFTNFLREGGRATVEWQSAGGWNVSGSAGVERQADRGGSTTSAGLTLFKNNLFGRRYQIGADASTYSGDIADGYVASLRLRRYWSGGHDVGITVGASEARLAGGEPRTNEWIRLSGTAQLPRDLYVVAELEYDTGTDLEGQRYIIELGYRF